MLKALGVIVMVALVGLLAYSFKGTTRSLYLPGVTTSGHYQIELECDSCHGEAFSGEEALQAACVRCHGEELKAANDSHPESKFTDPRNADRVAQLDARLCVTCHREHRPELISKMGLSLPPDYCYRCHQTIGEERPSHEGMAYDTCADAACHNFHDNRALYEDFLSQHLDDPDLLPATKNPPRRRPDDTQRLAAKDADAPAGASEDDSIRGDWAASAHAAGGVNCTDCHTSKAGQWQDPVPREQCAECHEDENHGYLAGRHGMREAAGLAPMRVADARLPMREDAHGKSLSCTSCHGDHRFDTRAAAVSACLTCHADTHSKNHERTEHARLWKADPSGQSGASCATCHLPRIARGDASRVQHNQNDTLRPNEKMVRPVCANCHGVAFALASLADEKSIASNFDEPPAGPPEGIRLVRKRLANH